MPYETVAKCLHLVESHPSHSIRITFSDGEIYLLKGVTALDSSVYRMVGEWTGEIVEVIQVKPESKGLHKKGAGLDFQEVDVLEIQDPDSNHVVYRRKE